MRDIKFRTWFSKQKDMVYNPNFAVLVMQTKTKEFEVMQYTGLKDSQLIEEYYGDIIISTFDGGDEWELFVIEDGLSAVLFRNIDTDEIWYFWQMPICYVIGNIYSYPELIK